MEKLSIDKVHRDVLSIHGDMKSLRSQFTEFHKKVNSSLAGTPSADSGKWKGAVASLSQEVTELRAAFQKMASTQPGAGAVAALSQEIAELRATSTEMAQLRQVQQTLRQQAEEAQRRSAQEQQELRELRRDQQSLRQEIQQFKGLASDLKREHGVVSLQEHVHRTQRELHALEKRMYESGMLTPKLEPPAPEAPPTVGRLELGEDVFSARLLLKLGFLKAEHDQARELCGPEDAAKAGSRRMIRDAHSDEDSDTESCWEHPDEVVSGLRVPEVEKGSAGYLFITTGWGAVCALTMFVQILVLLVIFGYGVHMGRVCTPDEQTPGEWWMLHLSKGLGVLVVGCLMGRDVMDTVNYAMTSALLDKEHDPEVAMTAVLRAVAILLTAVGNGVLFVIASSPEGIWLYVTALTFVGELGRSILGVAKSGVMGHHIAKAMSDINFNLTFSVEYPWWFSWVRHITASFMFGFIVLFATYIFFLPVPPCGKHGYAPNIFYHFWTFS